MKKTLIVPVIAAGLLVAACTGSPEDNSADTQPTAEETVDVLDVREDSAGGGVKDTSPSSSTGESVLGDDSVVEDDPIVNDLGETAQQEQARIDEWTVTDDEYSSEPQVSNAQELSLRIIDQAQDVVAAGYGGYAVDTPCAALRMYHTRTSISRVIAGSDGKGPRDDMYIQIIFADGEEGKATQKEYASLPYEDKVWVAGEYIDWLCGV